MIENTQCNHFVELGNKRLGKTLQPHLSHAARQCDLEEDKTFLTEFTTKVVFCQNLYFWPVTNTETRCQYFHRRKHEAHEDVYSATASAALETASPQESQCGPATSPETSFPAVRWVSASGRVPWSSSVTAVAFLPHVPPAVLNRRKVSHQNITCQILHDL